MVRLPLALTDLDGVAWTVVSAGLGAETVGVTERSGGMSSSTAATLADSAMFMAAQLSQHVCVGAEWRHVSYLDQPGDF